MSTETARFTMLLCMPSKRCVQNCWRGSHCFSLQIALKRLTSSVCRFSLLENELLYIPVSKTSNTTSRLPLRVPHVHAILLLRIHAMRMDLCYFQICVASPIPCCVYGLWYSHFKVSCLKCDLHYALDHGAHDKSTSQQHVRALSWRQYSRCNSKMSYGSRMSLLELLSPCGTWLNKQKWLPPCAIFYVCISACIFYRFWWMGLK